jgi:hypothetical protein
MRDGLVFYIAQLVRDRIANGAMPESPEADRHVGFLPQTRSAAGSLVEQASGKVVISSRHAEPWGQPARNPRTALATTSGCSRWGRCPALSINSTRAPAIRLAK